MKALKFASPSPPPTSPCPKIPPHSSGCAQCNIAPAADSLCLAEIALFVNINIDIINIDIDITSIKSDIVTFISQIVDKTAGLLNFHIYRYVAVILAFFVIF